MIRYYRLLQMYIAEYEYNLPLSQVEFVSEAVSKILSLYKGKKGTPTRCVIDGRIVVLCNVHS